MIVEDADLDNQMFTNRPDDIITSENVDSIIKAALAATQNFEVEVNFNDKMEPSTSITVQATPIAQEACTEEVISPASSGSDSDILLIHDLDSKESAFIGDQNQIKNYVISFNNDLMGSSFAPQPVDKEHSNSGSFNPTLEPFLQKTRF